jgi:hypothetical protein
VFGVVPAYAMYDRAWNVGNKKESNKAHGTYDRHRIDSNN